MMRSALQVLCAALLICGLTSTVMFAGGNKKKETKIALDKLPAAVKAAAEKAVAGLTITKAKMRTRNDTLTYEVEGKADGKAYEVKVATNGKVLKVEQEDDDDDGDDDDEEGDDD